MPGIFVLDHGCRHAGQFAEGFKRARPAKIVALPDLAGLGIEEFQLAQDLDAFRQDRQAEAAPQAHHGAYDGRDLVGLTVFFDVAWTGRTWISFEMASRSVETPLHLSG